MNGLCCPFFFSNWWSPKYDMENTDWRKVYWLLFERRSSTIIYINAPNDIVLGLLGKISIKLNVNPYVSHKYTLKLALNSRMVAGIGLRMALVQLEILLHVVLIET